MDQRDLGDGPITEIEQVATAQAGNSDETMRREARVLAALAGTGVPHPALIGRGLMQQRSTRPGYGEVWFA